MGRLFLGASVPDGSVLDSTHVEVPVNGQCSRATREVVLLATPRESSAGDTGLARICGPERIDTLIADETSDPATLRRIPRGRAE
ncbi:DeoR family transcriptional regulator OS=Streptomyces antimycoticus OX=68175 GN=SANT12839_084280 PE=4 SV=1 [Streptomyces antimycoticus]